MKKVITSHLEWDCQPQMDKIYGDAFDAYFATEDPVERERITKEAGEAQAKLMIAEIDRDAGKMVITSKK